MKKVRIGIDVGGTFTHAVIIDNSTLKILGYAVTPTTHTASEGVAAGVVKVFSMLQDKIKDDYEVIFVAHSTTQATNALLEGDVSSVGILAAGHGAEGFKTKLDANIPAVNIAEGKQIDTFFYYADTGASFSEEVAEGLSFLKEKKCGCIVAAEAFSVDDPSNEKFIKEQAAKLGIPACGTYEISGLYGLSSRTRTAVINASILPKMMETADMTEKGLNLAKSSVPLMVMRSDGGVMAISEMRKRPLLTLLSGPAAGIAAALAFIRATDAVFIETGGTSSDITVIKEGRAAVRSAVIGDKPTYMKTLDCRTIGVAGGSLAFVKDGKISAVGPRSAHIAGLGYLAFAPLEKLSGNLTALAIKPVSKGCGEYLAVKNESGDIFAVTVTCAANFLGYVKENDYAYGNKAAVFLGFKALEKYLSRPAEKIAEEIMTKASDAVIGVIRRLVEDYDLKNKKILLIGGGGGSAAILPYIAERLKSPYKLADNAEVISAIGAAMAMLRETVEKNIFNPSVQDLERLKREAAEAVIKMGALPESVDVFTEVDSQKNIARATASGSIEFKVQDPSASLSAEERKQILCSYFSVSEHDIKLEGETSFFSLYSVVRTEKKLFGLLSVKKTILAIIDVKGTIKRQILNGTLSACKKREAVEILPGFLEEHREYGDAGAVTRGCLMIAGTHIYDYGAIGTEERIISLASKELDKISDEETVYFVAL